MLYYNTLDKTFWIFFKNAYLFFRRLILSYLLFDTFDVFINIRDSSTWYNTLHFFLFNAQHYIQLTF